MKVTIQKGKQLDFCFHFNAGLTLTRPSIISKVVQKSFILQFHSFRSFLYQYLSIEDAGENTQRSIFLINQVK